MTAEEFEREHLALWTSEQGVYFEAELLDACAVDYELLAPGDWRLGRERVFTACAGVDWGFHPDRNALVLVLALQDYGYNGSVVHYVSDMEVHSRLEYPLFVDRIVAACGSYGVYAVASELNGPGAPNTQALRRALAGQGLGSHCVGVTTDQRRKMSGFSKIKYMLQAGELVLPREPELMRELHAVEYEFTDAGGQRIQARRGFHEDACMALLQAASCVEPVPNPDGWPLGGAVYPHVVTAKGVTVPLEPRPREGWVASFRSPVGSAPGRDPGW